METDNGIPPQPSNINEDNNPEFQNLHPLQNTWGWWFHAGGSSLSKKTTLANFDEKLRMIYNFHTVEDFWA